MRAGFSAGELWMADLTTNQNEPLLPGILATGFDVSTDGQRVVYSIHPPGGKSEIWLASTDGRSAPRRLSGDGDQLPRFGASGDLYFMAVEGSVNYLYRMREDGS